jgi:RNA polymerase sigma-70 factor (ECF subfamily)
MAHTEKELIRKIKEGSQEAFTELYQKYSDLLFAYVLHRLDNDREVASDIWQETWFVAIEKISDFNYGSSVFTWLCAIAKNKISDYFRLKEKHRKFDNEMKVTIDIDCEEIDDVGDEVQETVIKVLADLSEKYRYLLMARYFENKSVDEISMEIGKSYKATESLLNRSRNAFRKKFIQNK